MARITGLQRRREHSSRRRRRQYGNAAPPARSPHRHGGANRAFTRRLQRRGERVGIPQRERRCSWSPRPVSGADRTPHPRDRIEAPGRAPASHSGSHLRERRALTDDVVRVLHHHLSDRDRCCSMGLRAGGGARQNDQRRQRRLLPARAGVQPVFAAARRLRLTRVLHPYRAAEICAAAARRQRGGRFLPAARSSGARRPRALRRVTLFLVSSSPSPRRSPCAGRSASTSVEIDELPFHRQAAGCAAAASLSGFARLVRRHRGPRGRLARAANSRRVGDLPGLDSRFHRAPPRAACAVAARRPRLAVGAGLRRGVAGTRLAARRPGEATRRSFAVAPVARNWRSRSCWRTSRSPAARRAARVRRLDNIARLHYGS